MKFKKFSKNKNQRSLVEESPKIKSLHAEFFRGIEEELASEKYDEWEAEAIFHLFLKPDVKLENITPDNISKYTESVTALNAHQLI